VGTMGTRFLEMFRGVYNNIPQALIFWGGNMPQDEMRVFFNQLMVNVLLIILPILLIGYVVSFLCDLVQVKWKVSSKPLKPKLSKLNPLKGIKKIFSVNALVELVKAILKIALILYITYSFMKDKVVLIFSLYDMPLMQALSLVAETVTDLGIRIASVYAVIAMADYIYQKFKFQQDMKMTKQEVKDEYKNAEGDPQIKGKIRQKMREASMRRMMQALPQADVVITNPTHFAVAIQYDPEVADAPLVLAKGSDHLAARIKEIARENHIEIVENKPLARMLYANVEVGQMVPPELYQAVAEVLAFVYQLQGKI
ncbi:MAG: flagellar biosynthesis protein FlhB, partial [Acetatifactor sp.]|nr:flagellar biosynthesis protein FlhB [Acetatifactor sp.]